MTTKAQNPPILKILDDADMELISGGASGGSQADIDRLSTSLFGGPIFPGLEPEFPG